MHHNKGPQRFWGPLSSQRAPDQTKTTPRSITTWLILDRIHLATIRRLCELPRWRHVSFVASTTICWNPSSGTIHVLQFVKVRLYL